MDKLKAIACEPGKCKAARPSRCGCQFRFMFAGTKTVSVEDTDGRRASTVRVIWPDGSYIDHGVHDQ